MSGMRIPPKGPPPVPRPVICNRCGMPTSVGHTCAACELGGLCADCIVRHACVFPDHTCPHCGEASPRFCECRP